MELSQTQMIRKLLVEAYPGLRLTVIGESKPRFYGGDRPYKIEIEYNEEIAKELGVNQKMMRAVLRPLIDGEDYTYRGKTYNVYHLKYVVFKKKGFVLPKVSSELVDGIATKLNSLVEKHGEDAVREITQVLMEDMSRAQRVRFEGALEHVKTETTADSRSV